jgi:hypothetical protein
LRGGTLDCKKVFIGGENSVAAFSVNQTTGEPTLIQNADAWRGRLKLTLAS